MVSGTSHSTIGMKQAVRIAPNSNTVCQRPVEASSSEAMDPPMIAPTG